SWCWRWNSRRSSWSKSRTRNASKPRTGTALEARTTPTRRTNCTARAVSARPRGATMNLRANRTREDPEINFIPLIDVLLVILIFLMVTTTYQRFAELQITLPEADAEQVKQRPREINI